MVVRGIPQRVVRLMAEKVYEMPLAQIRLLRRGGEKTVVQAVYLRGGDGRHGPACVPRALRPNGRQKTVLTGIIAHGETVRRRLVGGGRDERASAEHRASRIVGDRQLAVFGSRAEDEKVVRRGRFRVFRSDSRTAEKRRGDEKCKKTFQFHISSLRKAVLYLAANYCIPYQKNDVNRLRFLWAIAKPAQLW